MKITLNAADDWNETIRLHGWPECGDGSIEIERLYQAFKARLVSELMSEGLTKNGQKFRICVERE